MSATTIKRASELVLDDLVDLGREWWSVRSIGTRNRCGVRWVVLALSHFCHGIKLYEVSPTSEWSTRQTAPTAVKASVTS